MPEAIITDPNLEKQHPFNDIPFVCSWGGGRDSCLAL